MSIWARIQLWLSQFYLYILGAALVALAGMGLLLYIDGLKLGRARAEKNTAVMSLKVSNDSVKSLTIELGNVQTKLVQQAKIDKQLQDDISQRLKDQAQQDHTLIDLEKRLRERPVTLNCSIPKDLQDAWNRL